MAGKVPADSLLQSDFFQDVPRLGNQFDEDSFLQEILARFVPSKHRPYIESDLRKFGDRTFRQLWPIAKQMDQPAHQPRLVHYDAWGRRVDDIETSPGWKFMKTVAAEEGLIAIGYERKSGAYSRLHQFSKLYMYGCSSGLFTCPLAMTDGAARLLELRINERNNRDWKDVETDDDLITEAYERLTSRDPSRFWTSGQWMTERQGGSDVASGTRTVAKPLQASSSPHHYALHGYKWFTSATDADMTITLARIEDPSDHTVLTGTRGLSCFIVKVRKDDGMLNNMQIARLKNKLGTKQLPTAEMRLQGSRASLLSKVGRGVPTIANMVNVTRLYNATSACGTMRRMLALCRDYMHRRKVFGSLLSENPLHLRTIFELEMKFRASLLICFDSIRLLGATECRSGVQSDDELLLRLLTPLVKLFTAKMTMSVVSEGLECFGGQGYIEDTGLPGMLRDSQVLPIWEGTTNVLSMDVLRVAQKSRGKALHVFMTTVLNRCRVVSEMVSPLPHLPEAAEHTRKAAEHLQKFINANMKSLSSATLVSRARDLAYSLSRLYAASCLIEHAVHTRATKDCWAALVWASGQVDAVGSIISPSLRLQPNADAEAAIASLALDTDASGRPRGFGDYSTNGQLRSSL